MNAPRLVNVVITLAQTAGKDVNVILQRLKQAGLSKAKHLKSLGVVTGSAESGKVSSLSHVEGVHAVEQERESSIPPPDAPVQ